VGDFEKKFLNMPIAKKGTLSEPKNFLKVVAVLFSKFLKQNLPFLIVNVK